MSESCACGCGEPLGRYAVKYRHGHWAKANREKIGDMKRKGVIEHTKGGYLTEFDKNGKRRLQHVVIAQEALGKPLPDGAEVHHVNRLKQDNSRGNLVICPDRAYHVLLHVRTTAYESCGDANKRKCAFCGKWDLPKNLYIPRGAGAIEHRACGNAYRNKRTRERMIAAHHADGS